MITKEMLPRSPGKLYVTFSVPASIWADSIHLVGDFNDWSVASIPLRQTEDGWSVSLLLDCNRAYTYRYRVDRDHWMNDSRADRHVLGSDGSVLSVVHTYA